MSTINTTNLKNPSSGSNNVVLNADGTSTLTPSNIIKSGTAVASTSGTSIDFTGIPSWAKKITVMFDGVSTSGTSIPLIQLGDSGGIETTGYAGTVVATAISTAGFPFYTSWAAAQVAYGMVQLSLLNSSSWVLSGVIAITGDTPRIGGSKTLSATLDRVRITTVNGTDTFDAGTINILYEG